MNLALVLAIASAPVEGRDGDARVSHQRFEMPFFAPRDYVVDIESRADTVAGRAVFSTSWRPAPPRFSRVLGADAVHP